MPGRVGLTSGWSKGDGTFVLEVRDDGIGIGREVADLSTSLGLIGMRERAALVGAHVEVTGMRGQGTWFTVHMPVEDATTRTLIVEDLTSRIS